MVMLDTNIILRYLLNDNKQMADEAEKIIKENTALVTIEIIAEVVYVLKRVYSIERDVIKSSLFDFLSEVQSNEMEVIKLGLTVSAPRLGGCRVKNSLPFKKTVLTICVLNRYKC